jgi:hypothetical protein
MNFEKKLSKKWKSNYEIWFDKKARHQIRWHGKRLLFYKYLSCVDGAFHFRVVVTSYIEINKLYMLS